jgi:long-chain-fatty-acid---luciferin-component ligase
VITAGGWKRATGSVVPRDELTDLVVSAFALPEGGQVRDCFNMVELNSVLFECEHQVKHVPPWLRVTARDPGTLEVLPSGAQGTLAFLDALPTSYPGFLLSDDFGTVRYGVACPCGRTSDVLDVTRRIQTVEARGCALKMDGTVRR